MSDLVVTYDGLSASAKACLEPSPPPKAAGDYSNDACQWTVPLAEVSDSPHNPRLMRFDRRGDQFVPSASNPAELKNWFHQHGNARQVQDIVKIGSLMTRTSDSTDDFSVKLRFLLAQYVLTGVVRYPNLNMAKTLREGGNTQVDLANLLLGSFTMSSPEAVAKTLGALLLARGDRQIGSEARERIQWVISLIDLVPIYNKAVKNFVSEKDLADLDALPVDKARAVKDILSYVRNVILRKWFGLQLDFDKDLQNVFFSFHSVKDEGDLPKQVKTFCSRLELALDGIVRRGPAEVEFYEDCRQGLLLTDLPAEATIRESLRSRILGERGRGRLQELIRSESEAARMSVAWLHERQRLEDVLKIVLKNVKIDFPPPKGQPRLGLNVDALKLDVELKVDQPSAVRRERILSALVLLLDLFGTDGEIPEPRIFYQGQFQKQPWALNAEEKKTVRDLIKSLRRRLEISQVRTEVVLPVMEGVTCAMGIAGLGLTEGLGAVKQDRNLHLGLGTTSAALLGGGCSALASHFLLPVLAKNRMRNRFVWEGVTAAIGATVSAGIYLLGNLTGSRSAADPSAKYPTDTYGP